MKVNNKGFVATALLYGLLVIFLFLIVGLLAMLQNRKMILDKLKGDIKEELNGMTEYKVYENGTAIYYNPVTGEICSDYEEDNSLDENKTGCLKWYTFNDNKNKATVNMILDHNTTKTIAWINHDDYIEAGGTEEDWNNNTRNDKGYVTLQKELDKLVDESNWKVSPRIISASELSTITNTTTFDKSNSTWFYFDGTGEKKQTASSVSQGNNVFAWLFDYTSGCESRGCNIEDSSNSGYWTSDSVSNIHGNAWFVYKDGFLADNNVGTNNAFGVRPVITLNKKILIKPFTVAYDYTGSSQSFVRPVPGNYKLEVWGAQGGTAKYLTYTNISGGYGGYSTGYISLLKNQRISIVVGSQGESSNYYEEIEHAGGYNGGGTGENPYKNKLSAGGGGATHISTVNNLLTLQDINNVFIIAGGGGGSTFESAVGAGYGGSGGGYIGGTGYTTRTDNWCLTNSSCTPGAGGTDNNGLFGYGANSGDGSGGGAGYYGGKGSVVGGGGGSGYIANSSLTDKHMTCYNCKTSNEESIKTITNECHNKEAKEDCSKEGNGYAKITYLGE